MMETRTVQKFQIMCIVALTMWWLLAYAGCTIVWAFKIQTLNCPVCYRGRAYCTLQRSAIKIHFINLFERIWQSKTFLPICNSHGIFQVFENNAACIESAKEPSCHIGLSTPWQFNCFTVIVMFSTSKILGIEHIHSTNEQIADIFTKLLYVVHSVILERIPLVCESREDPGSVQSSAFCLSVSTGSVTSHQWTQYGSKTPRERKFVFILG